MLSVRICVSLRVRMGAEMNEVLSTHGPNHNITDIRGVL